MFGPEDQREPSGRRIFRPSLAPPAPPTIRPDALARLLQAASEAETAQHELSLAKSRYQRSPTQAHLQQLLDVAARALERECVFDELWDEVSRHWFGEGVPAPAV